MKNREQKDHSFGKRSLGFLLLFVCAAEEAETSGGCGIHGATELRNHGERGAQDLRSDGFTELRKARSAELRNYGERIAQD